MIRTKALLWVIAGGLAGALCATGAAGEQPRVYEPRETGPVRGSRAPDLVLWDFAPDGTGGKIGGGGPHEAALTGGPVPCGAGALRAAFPASSTGPVGVVWAEVALDDPRRDWSGFDWLVWWWHYPAGSALDRGLEGGVGHYRVVVLLRDGSGTWFERGALARSYMRDTWQPVRLPLSGRWSPKGSDKRQVPDWHDIREVRLEFGSHKQHPIEVTLACLGLRRDDTGAPALGVQSRSDGFLTSPGRTFTIRLEGERLPEGRKVEAVVEVLDFWRKPVFSWRESFSGAAGRAEKDVSFRIGKPGFYDIGAELLVDGRPVWRATRGLACLPQLTAAQNIARRRSPFGIWPAGDYDVLGAGVTRVGFGPPMDAAAIGDIWQPPIRDVPYYAWIGGGVDFDAFQSQEPANREKREDFERRLEAAARLYAKGWSPYIDWFPYFGVLNEPNAHYWGPMENVVAFNRLVRDALRRGHPGLKVGGPAPYCIDVNYIEKFLDAGGGCMDFIDTHGYQSDEDLLARLRDLKAMLARKGFADKEIIISEMGVPVPNETPESQAAKLVRSYAVALSEGVRAVIWHTFLGDIDKPGDRPVNNDDPLFNIIRPDNTPNPAFVAYGIMTRMLLGATAIGEARGLPESCRGFEFRRPGGGRLLVLWRKAAGTETVKLPDGDWNTLTDIMGVSRPVKSAADGTVSVEASENPVYIGEK